MNAPVLRIWAPATGTNQARFVFFGFLARFLGSSIPESC
jgi:hypothetical protein